MDGLLKSFFGALSLFLVCFISYVALSVCLCTNPRIFFLTKIIKNLDHSHCRFLRSERELYETNYITRNLYKACKCQAVWFSVAVVLLNVFVGVSYVTCVAQKTRRNRQFVSGSVAGCGRGSCWQHKISSGSVTFCVKPEP